MNSTQIAGIACIALAALMVLASIAGHALGRRSPACAEDASAPGSGLIHSAVLALLGLLLAFCFSQAYERFQHRRELIVAEANAVGTMRLRLDLLSAAERSAARTELREHTEARVLAWEYANGMEAQTRELARADRAEAALWSRMVSVTITPEGAPLRMLLLPPLNELIDLSAERLAYIHAHPPLPVGILLFGVALICALLSGMGFASRNRLPIFHVATFALLCAGTIYLIFDMEYARFGLVNLKEPHRLLAAEIEALR
ncbi:MAG: hypothetical protein IPN34_18395 [Planctomycetes bacterium]|nr:hypothetical protein [Planctomycetota bacterium]